MLGIEVLGGCWVVGGGCGVKNGFICGLRRLLGRWCSPAVGGVRALGGVWSACGVLWGMEGSCRSQRGGYGASAGILCSISAAPLLTDDRPQRPDARSTEVGVGRTEDFADGCGGDGGCQTVNRG